MIYRLRDMIYGLRRMIYLLCKHDIISVPIIREALFHKSRKGFISLKRTHTCRRQMWVLFCLKVTKRSRIEVKVSKSSAHAPLDRLKYVSY